MGLFNTDPQPEQAHEGEPGHGYCRDTPRRVRNCPLEACMTLGACCAGGTSALVDTSPAPLPPLTLKGIGNKFVVVDEKDPVDHSQIDAFMVAKGENEKNEPVRKVVGYDPATRIAARDGGSRADSPMRGFATGATRSSDAGRIDPEGFTNPLVEECFYNYMNKHRVQADGNLRASDNWQKGMPRESAIKGMMRHVLHLWTRHRGLPVTDEKAAANMLEDLAAIRFNVGVYMWEIIRENIRTTGRPW